MNCEFLHAVKFLLLYHVLKHLVKKNKSFSFKNFEFLLKVHRSGISIIGIICAFGEMALLLPSVENFCLVFCSEGMSAMLLIKSKTSQTIVSVGSLGIENFEQNHYSLEWKLKLLTDRNSKAKYNSFNLHVSFIFQNQ